MEWAPLIFKPNGAIIKTILKNHPEPNIPYYLQSVLDALHRLASERQYINTGDSIISGRIPYSSILRYMEHKVSPDLHDIFEELLLYTDECWFNKSEELRNKKVKT